MQNLLIIIQKKDKQAVETLYNLYGKKLYGYAMYHWKVTEDEAWELIYKTLYKIMNVIDKYKFETESKFNGFVFQVFINNLRNQYNDKKAKHVDVIQLNETHGNTANKELNSEEELSTNPYMNCLKKILEQLDDWKRILLLMKAQDFSYDEIAKYVDKPSEQLKVYYMRAKKIVTNNVNECVMLLQAKQPNNNE